MTTFNKFVINGTIEYECRDYTLNGNTFEAILNTNNSMQVAQDTETVESIDIYNPDGLLLKRLTDYDTSCNITLMRGAFVENSNAIDTIRVAFKKASLDKKVAELDKKVNGVVDEEKMSLDEYKEYKIAKTKTQLNEFLEANPITSTAHGGVEGVYSITKEKQDLMTSNYLTYTIKKKVTPESAVLTWNETGKECEIWEEAEFIQLVMEIESRVKPLVSYQQSIESKINESCNKSDIAAIVCDYATVGEINEKIETTT